MPHSHFGRNSDVLFCLFVFICESFNQYLFTFEFELYNIAQIQAYIGQINAPNNLEFYYVLKGFFSTSKVI